MSQYVNTWILKRVSKSDKATRGVVIDPQGEPYCVSLENPWKDNQPYISCIPEGEYLVTWTHSEKYDRMMYLINDVPGRSGNRIHSGNYSSHTKGCPLFGRTFFMNGDEPGIGDSRTMVKQFEEKMNGEPFLLRIESC